MSSELASILLQTDMSAPSIQKGASAMMVHYDRSPQVAVTEWRNVLQNCSDSQLLPLLYVANEVLQNSKRNRGNKFLEAFSPILGQALIFICQRDSHVTEKVRRTTKIWADRRVFSVRFVNELLHGLEKFRHFAQEQNEEEGRFSPTHTSKALSRSPSPIREKKVPQSTTTVTPQETIQQEGEDGDDDMFAFDSPSQRLEIDVPIVASTTSSTTRKKKRRNSSMTHGESPNAVKKRRKSILSTASLMELWNQTSELQQSFDSSTAAISLISPQHLSTDASVVEQLVGDELVEEHKQNIKFQASVQKQRVALHHVASERRVLEQEAVSYIPWLRSAMQQDVEDLATCQNLITKLTTLQVIHAQAKSAREERLQMQKENQRKMALLEKQKQQEEERRIALEEALRVNREAKPGMVWNPTTREYQKLDTDESWRD